MIFTEEEAKKKICSGPPNTSTMLGALFQAKVTELEGSKITEFSIEMFCCGSKCMAWRWFDSISDDGKCCHWKPTNLVMRHPDDTKDKPLDQRRGYCGLAGQP